MNPLYETLCEKLLQEHARLLATWQNAPLKAGAFIRRLESLQGRLGPPRTYVRSHPHHHHRVDLYLTAGRLSAYWRSTLTSEESKEEPSETL